MEKRYYHFRLGEIFIAWKKLEEADRKTLENELETFKIACRTYYNMITRHFGRYSSACNFYINNVTVQMPIINEFFRVVRDVSEEAYQFMTEGHDVLNFKEYIVSHERKISNISGEVFRLSNYSEFLAHTILKILDEPDERKKRLMIRGFIGM